MSAAVPFRLVRAALSRALDLGDRVLERLARPPVWTGPPPGAPPGFLGVADRWIQPGAHVPRPGDDALGFGLLERWAAAAHPHVEGGTRLTCRSLTIPALPPATAPHALVDAADLVIDFSRLRRASTPRFRPDHRKGRRQLHRYEAGALAGQGRAVAGAGLGCFPRDHLRDVFGSLALAGAPPHCDVEVTHPVLFVTREGLEARNLFHATTDLLNAFQAALVCGVARADAEVVLLDAARPAPFDALWPRVFAPRRGVRRVGDFRGARVRFRHAVFVPPGYTSQLYAWLREPAAITSEVALLEAFAELVVRATGLDPERPRAPGPLRAVLVSRRPAPGSRAVRRALSDEAACLAALAALPGVDARTVDLAALSIEAQIELATRTDLLAGVHGAGLTHLLWLPPHAAVLEIDPTGGPGWRCYEHLAAWTGHGHARLEATERIRGAGSVVHVDPARLREVALRLAQAIAARLASTG